MKEKHEIHKVRGVSVIGDYKLLLTFEDGKTHIVDLEGVLFGEIYTPLNDLALFKQVRLDPEVPTIVWPNGADFDPETLYYWDEYLPEWQKAAEESKKKEMIEV